MGKIAERIREARQKRVEDVIEDFDKEVRIHIDWGKSSWEYCTYDIASSEDFIAMVDILKLKYKGELKIKIKQFSLMFGYHELKVKVIGV